MENNEFQASPRDNVIFEAGYFMKAKGKERILIIQEEGTKMPADIGGNIYLPLKKRNDISTITADIQYFLENRL
ncbi:MAG: TIR domain-containing protein [Flavobacterium sp.]|uniref:TIR domain-containing protein n=1 Tax=Flavobacterium sp. TaxID=239 RepID=UPI0032633730